MNLQTVVEACCSVIRTHGFVSQSQAQADSSVIPSSKQVHWLLLNYQEQENLIKDCDRTQARDILQFWQTYTPKGEYEYNICKILCGLHPFHSSAVALIVSAVGTHEARAEKQLDQQLDQLVSKHVGVVGDFLQNLELVVRSVKKHECSFTRWGQEHRGDFYWKVRAVDHFGNVFQWSHTREPSYAKDNEITVRAKIVGHISSVGRNIKINALRYVKLVSDD